MKRNIRYCSLIATYFCAIAALSFSALKASGQSIDPEHPTAVMAYPITGTLGSGTFYYSVPANAGIGKIYLEFHPPAGGGSASVSLSGPDCCSADAYVGADSGSSAVVTQRADFDIPSRQTLLVTLTIAVAPSSTVRFILNLAGTIGTGGSAGGGGTVPGASRCTDLAMLEGFTLSVSGTTRTISGTILNLSDTDFRSPAGRQWIEVVDIAKLRDRGPVVQRIPFTDVTARGSLPISATHTTSSLLAPKYKLRIVYSPDNATDTIMTNDDCNLRNNETLRYPVVRRV